MPTPYNHYTYIYPPRAGKAIPPEWLDRYEEMGWIAQAKKNGTNSVIFISPEKKVFAKNRHAKDHARWQFNEETSHIFKSLPGKGWYVFNGELIHAKVKGMRNIHFLHDILVNDGEYLLRETYSKRWNLLCSLILRNAPANNGTIKTHWIVNDFTWLAKNIHHNFSKTFEELNGKEDEGLVLKKMDGRLGYRDGTNAPWAVKCRYPTSNVTF